MIPRARTVLIGLGNIGLGYDIDGDYPFASQGTRTHAAALVGSQTFELVECIDPDATRLRLASELLSSSVASSINESRAEGIDVVVIAAPTDVHLQTVTEAVAKWNPRMVLCEKPVGRNSTEASQVRDLLAANGTLGSVNYFRASLPETAAVGQLLARRETGDLLAASVSYSHGLRRNGCHFLQLLSGWLGPIVNISRMPDAGMATGPTPSFEVDFSRGVCSFVSRGDGDERYAEIDLAFEGGKLEYRGGGRSILWTVCSDGGRNLTEGVDVAVFDSSLQTYQGFVYRRMAEVLASEGNNPCDLDEAVGIQRAIDRVVRDDV